MLKIRPEQSEVFQPVAEGAFVAEVVDYLRKTRPDEVVRLPGGPTTVARIPDEILSDMVRGGWRYHVAPTVKVQGSDGKTKDMVMDPSLFDKPVIVDEWKKRQQDDKSKIETTDDKPYFRGPGDKTVVEDKDGAVTKTKLAEHTRNRDKRKLSKGE